MVDRSALEDAYRLHGTDLTRFAAAMVGPDDAPDVVVEAMLRVFDEQLRIEHVRNLRAYLFRAVHHRVIDVGRSSRRRRRRDAAYAALRPVAAPDVDAAAAADARAALAFLSTQQRAVVVLTYWSDLTPGEIAAVLDVSDGAVRKQLARARARLREVLDVK